MKRFKNQCYVVMTYNDIHSVNVGDYVQSIAAKSFVGDGTHSQIVYHNRDELRAYAGPEAKIIMNGWFTYKPDNFPPSSRLHPLFISFHLNGSFIGDLLSRDDVIDYLKGHEPIGCRDTKTVELLQARGINAYFSGCLTLTIGITNRFCIRRARSKIVFVDPVSYMPHGNSVKEVLSTSFKLIRHYKQIIRVYKKLKANSPVKFSFSKVGIGRFLLLTESYMLAENILSHDALESAEWYTHLYTTHELGSDEDRFAYAYHLLQIYASAKFILTSRIHCALPSLGFETPVILLRKQEDELKSSDRLGGIGEFFNTIWYRGSDPINLDDKITFEEIEKLRNPSAFRPFRDRLIQRVRAFLFENE